MRRTGSEEIGSSKTLSRGSDSCLLRVLLSVHFFGEAPERRPWILEHDDAGRFLPGFHFALGFIRLWQRWASVAVTHAPRL